MIVTLEKAKEYLRVESPDEDMLITGFIETAEDITSGILRFPVAEFETVPGAVAQSILYLVACFYENRESLNMKEALQTVLGLLAPYRKETW